jgi:hypothetical protein
MWAIVLFGPRRILRNVLYKQGKRIFHNTILWIGRVRIGLNLVQCQKKRLSVGPQCFRCGSLNRVPYVYGIRSRHY